MVGRSGPYMYGTIIIVLTLIGLNHKEALKYFKFGRCQIDNVVDMYIPKNTFKFLIKTEKKSFKTILYYIGQTVSEATLESYVGVNLFQKEKDQAIDM